MGILFLPARQERCSSLLSCSAVRPLPEELRWIRSWLQPWLLQHRLWTWIWRLWLLSSWSYYGKREAEAEPEADPYYGYGYSGLYSGLRSYGGYGYGLGYSRGYSTLGYSGLGYSRGYYGGLGYG